MSVLFIDLTKEEDHRIYKQYSRFKYVTVVLLAPTLYRKLRASQSVVSKVN